MHSSKCNRDQWEHPADREQKIEKATHRHDGRRSPIVIFASSTSVRGWSQNNRPWRVVESYHNTRNSEVSSRSWSWQHQQVWSWKIRTSISDVGTGDKVRDGGQDYATDHGFCCLAGGHEHRLGSREVVAGNAGVFEVGDASVCDGKGPGR